MKDEPLKILCIDDDEEIRFALKAVFDYQGWQPCMAAGVPEGLALFAQAAPDLVLIDYHLPRINGIEGVRRLRQLSPTVPIIVFTIDDDQRVADEFLKAGASDFALKPIKVPDIISRIRLHIRLMESERKSAAWEYTKGISGPTLELILDCLSDREEFLTMEAIAEQTGLAYQTTYRYIQYLLSENRVEAKSIYGKVGRPKQCYRLTEGRA